jgi:uncharacterized protein YdiU (UPF0061 family)
MSSSAKGPVPDELLTAIIRNLKESEERSIFESFDVDRSGNICETDWESALTKLGVTITKRDRTDLLAYLDVNKDGNVDLADFKKSIASIREKTLTVADEAVNLASFESWLRQYDSRAPGVSSEDIIDKALADLIRKKVIDRSHPTRWVSNTDSEMRAGPGAEIEEECGM